MFFSLAPSQASVCASSFVVVILKNSRYKTGWNVQARVQLKMRPASGEKDRNLLLSIQEFFGGIGNISKPNNASTVEFRINIQEELVNVVLPLPRGAWYFFFKH